MFDEGCELMETVRDYLLSITAAALVCGCINSLAAGNGTISKILKLLCGLFLAASVIKPVVDIKITDVYRFTDQLALDANYAVSDGEQMAMDEMKRIIKEKTETYILDKAKTLGADLNVEVILDGVVPVGVMLTGDISPYAKVNLCETISQELGIPLKEQVWSRT